jgi:tetratricopeptide (TPR) repeat protein
MDNVTVESLCQQARDATKEHDFEKARQLYSQALGLQADSTDALYGLGTVCFMIKDLPNAVEYFKRVLEYEPRRAAVHINLGAIYNRLGEYDKAIESLRRGIQYDPHRAEGYYNLGLVYKTKREQALAMQAYREAIRINPRMADAHLNLANLLVEREDYHAARTHYQKALEIQPNWEAAERGLARAEEALQAARAKPAAPAAPQPQAPKPSAFDIVNVAADQGRSIDPNAHAEYLSTLHRTTIETEGQAQRFIQVLAEQMEPAVKELSSCLLVHGGVALAIDLEECLEKLDMALENLTGLHGEMQNNLTAIREKTAQMLKT